MRRMDFPFSSRSNVLGGRLLKICEAPRDYFGWYEDIPRHRIYQLDL